MMKLEDILGEKGVTDPLVMAGQFSPDGQIFSFLRGRHKNPTVMDLWGFDLITKKSILMMDSDQLMESASELSEEEKARRERQRLFVGGITTYQWSSTGKEILFPKAGAIFLHHMGGLTEKVIESGTMDSRFSPNGQYISWVSKKNLFVYHLKTARIQQITFVDELNTYAGSSEFVAEEELGRFEGHWWSDNDAYLAYEVYDESAVSVVKRQEFYVDRMEVVEQRYPFAGTPNVDWRIEVVKLDTLEKQVVPFKLKDSYFGRGAWNRGVFFCLVLNREQTKASIYSYDPKSSLLNLIYEENSTPWYNLVDQLRFTPDGDLVILTEQHGFSSILVLSRTGSQKAFIKLEDESVIRISRVFKDCIDVECSISDGMRHVGRRYYFEKDKPYLDLTTSDNSVNMIQSSKDGRWLAVTRSETHAPQEVYVVDLSNNGKDVIYQSSLLPTFIDQLLAPEFGQITVESTKLNYRLIKPNDFDPKVKYPAVVHVYGGPHAQRVNYGWAGASYLFAQYLANQGFIVFTLDGRGSANRGKSFETPIYKAFGSTELADQVAGAKYLMQLDFVDSSRVGIYGWSYGGYLTLMALFKHPDIFKVGSSGAPVTDWKLYDSAYTERYLGSPSENDHTYHECSVFPWLENFQGKLQLIHGMADDNVLYSHSTKLYSELQKNGKQFEIQAYPGEKHALATPKMKIHCHHAITRFFKENL